MYKILVTGGNGFLGKQLVNLLKEKYGSENIFSPTSKELNLLDIDSLDIFLKSNKVDLIIHLAARMAGIGELTVNPLPYLEDNLIINYNIVKIAMKYNIDKFITLGSSCGYNNNTPIPMNEDEFWNKKPENTYGLCKLVLLEHLQSQNEMKWVYLVPANIYGPGDHFGENNAHLIPATVLKFENALESNSSSIDVWGDGSQVRDFIYIDDVVNIIYNTIDNEKYEGRAINISTNNGTSIKDVVELIRKYMNLDSIEINWDISKPTGILKKVLNNKIVLEIEKDYTLVNIEDGIRRTIEWYNEKIKSK